MKKTSILEIETELAEVRTEMLFLKKKELNRLLKLYVSGKFAKSFSEPLLTVLVTLLGDETAKGQNEKIQRAKEVRQLTVFSFFFKKGVQKSKELHQTFSFASLRNKELRNPVDNKKQTRNPPQIY